MDKQAEQICVQRFLNWYNEEREGNYIHQRATSCFRDDLNKSNKGDWDFVAQKRDNQKEWIGIEVKELSTFMEVDGWSAFWDELCLELTQDLADKGVQGKFKIIHPPVFHLKPRERMKFREAFVEILTDKESILNITFTDIGPDIADKFSNWPREKSKNRDEYRKWGGCRPAELKINKSPDSRCEVTGSSPIVVRDGVEIHKQTFNEADIKHANKQLNLAKEKGARETILLFACKPFIYEHLIKNLVQNLDHHLISDIDYIYLIDMGSEGKVVKIYPNL